MVQSLGLSLHLNLQVDGYWQVFGGQSYKDPCALLLELLDSQSYKTIKPPHRTALFASDCAKQLGTITNRR
eukprot:1159511-Pelagomonas_calceolata.AAC.3